MDYHAWSGQVWRLMTSTLPHVGILHLLFNLYWLWVFGTRVEIVYGSGRTLLILMLFAAGSSAAQYALAGPGVGLSGVGYGLFGFLWILGRFDRRFYGLVDHATVQLFVVWFFLCIALTVADVWSVGNVAHGMGAVLGVLLGYAVSAPLRNFRLASRGALAVLLLASFAAGAWGLRYVDFSNGIAREAQMHGYKGDQAIMAEDYPRAVKEYRQALELDEKESRYWYNLGIAYAELGSYPEARAAFHRAIELDPDDEQYRKAAEYWTDRER